MQSMKAGVLELPDIVAVNKADLGAIAQRTTSELEAGIGLGEDTTVGWKRPVLRISAQQGTGLDELETAIADHRSWLVESGELPRRRARSRDRAVEEALAVRYGSFGIGAIGGPEGLAERLAADPLAPAARLLAALSAEIERALTSGEDT